jgi:nucleotide-binding universal stress UspA family protein
MSRNSRLLVAHVGPDIDPHVIRYATMVARLAAAPADERARTSLPEMAGLNVAAAGPGRSQRRRNRKPISPAIPSDAEVRFLTLLPTAADRDPIKAARSQRIALRSKVDRNFRRPHVHAAVACEVVRRQSTDCVLTYLSDFDGDLLLLARGRWTGSQLARLAMESPCSTWVVPPGWAPVLRRVLVPLDFSRSSAGALQAAIQLARRFPPAKCLALHVDRHDTRCGDDAIGPSRRRQLISGFEKIVSKIDTSGVRVVPVLVKGQHVARSIARSADENSADLIAMTTRGRTRLAGTLLPSVTGDTIRGFQGPVLAIKRMGSTMRWRDAARRHWEQAENPYFS